MVKYILVSGGVVSGVGKGLIAASVGVLLKSCGWNVTAVGLDPYLVRPFSMFAARWPLFSRPFLLVSRSFALFCRSLPDGLRSFLSLICH